MQYHDTPAINDIIANAQDADYAFSDLREYAINERGTGAFAYFLGLPLLKKRFTERESMDAIHTFAQFDQDDKDSRLAQRAKRFIEKFDNWRGEPQFIKDLIEHEIAVYKTDTMLFVAHKCQKPDSKRYQVSRFVKGMGVSGDSTHNTPEEILSCCVVGAGIPNSAEYVPHNDIFALEQEFQVDMYH
ncbi:hypothetical protein P3447_09170 [Vibrio parahaemolyticus]|nr:hypothetical protein [Vibrio parahaemolyticus]